MAQYNYIAVDSSGVKKIGIMEDTSSDMVAKKLQNENYSVISINERSALFSGQFLHFHIGGVPLKERTIFLRQMSYMINAGLPITQSLEIMLTQTVNKQFKTILELVLKDVQDGLSLSKAFAKFPKAFDDVVVNLVKAAEESGNLDLIFDRLATFKEKEGQLNAKIRGALIYPAVISTVMVGVIIFLIVYLVPTVKNIYNDLGSGNAPLPWITQFFIGLSDLFTNFWWLLIGILVFIIISYKYYVSTKAGRIAVDTFKLHVPVFGTLIVKSQLAQFAKTLSMLMKSGVPILESINMVSSSLKNTAFKMALAEVSASVEKGASLSSSLAQHSIMPVILSQMTATGEQTGKIDELLNKLGDYYSQEVDEIADNLTKLLEPIILLIMGGMAGVVAVAVYLPIFSINTAIK